MGPSSIYPQLNHFYNLARMRRWVGEGLQRPNRHSLDIAQSLSFGNLCSQVCSDPPSERLGHDSWRTPFDRHLVSPTGMRARFDRATDRIRGTGWRWQNWSAFPESF